MADKKKKGSDTPKSDKKIVLRDLKSSQYARKKYTVKSTDRFTASKEAYAEAGNKAASENSANINNGNSKKTRNAAHKSMVSSKRNSSREKRAAYIKEKLQRDIAADKADDFSDSDNLPDSFQSPSGTESVGTALKENTENKFQSRFLGNSEKIGEYKHKNSLENAEVRQAYKKKMLEAQMKKRKEAIIDRSQAQTNAALISAEKAKAAAMKNADAETNIRDNVIPGLEMAGEYISAVKNGDAVGMITQPAVSVIKNNMGSLSGISDGISTISGAVQSSDSVGGAAVNAGTSLAASKMKSAVTNALFKPSDEKIAERLEKKLRYIDRKTDKQMSRIQKEKAEAMNGSISKNLEKKLDKIERNQEKYKQKLAKQRKELQRKQQKNIYIKHNRKNPAFVGNKLKKKVGSAGGKSKLLLLGSGASVMFVILVIIILLILISSLFSWLSPYDFSLAGDESGEQTEAKTEEEIIDGYAKLIQNYMDVTQAYYYFVYGDWYGGVYDYPAPDISFSDFLAQFQSKLISDIQAKYSSAFAAAETPEEVAAISRAMSAEISAALQASVYQARIEYDALMKALDDSMRAQERRQHYEVYNGGGGNGAPDSSEFTGMPIVGTNHFGNVEIKSDLSAEELLAMTALYKSLKVIGSEDEADADAEVVYNITTDDIMEFFKETEFIPITTEITHDHSCDGICRRRLIGDYESGYSWEYYCNNNHDWLSGEIGTCKTKDELIEKIFELTNAEENGIDEESAEEIIESYLKTINEKLGISERDYRRFGAADNVRAKAFYEMLIDPLKGSIPNNFWTVDTPLG